jgi:hypothetical protein
MTAAPPATAPPAAPPPLIADDRAALLAHELLDVIRPETALAGRPAALPAAERLDAGPRAGRRAGAAVDVDDARLDLVQEPGDLVLVAAEDPGGQPVVDGVRLGEASSSDATRVTVTNGTNSSARVSGWPAGRSLTTVGCT